MPHYIMLMKLTEQGAKTIKEAPARVEAAFKAAEAIGGKSLGFYLTMGEYDYVSVVEGASDEAMAVFLLGPSALGIVKTTTLKAFTGRSSRARQGRRSARRRLAEAQQARHLRPHDEMIVRPKVVSRCPPTKGLNWEPSGDVRAQPVHKILLHLVAVVSFNSSCRSPS
jgi:uncharacterized protein with GYD domain